MSEKVRNGEKLFVRGGQPLRGRVRISGAKNATLAILAASMLADEEVIVDNVPQITDVNVMLTIMAHMGARVQWLGPEMVKIKPPTRLEALPPYDLVKKLRASNLLLGPLLAKYGRAEVALPGGCNIGIRPMDLHFKGLAAMGAQLEIKRGAIIASRQRLKGSRIYLDFPSVGATENIMMAACLAEGQTIIENVAKEPEIVDLANFLNCIGAKVRGAGTDVIRVQGVEQVGGCRRYAVIPDRIEAGTYMVAAVATRGEVLLENVIPTHLEPVAAKLREAGAEVLEVDEDEIMVRAKGELRPVDIKTLPYPGFPTDMQSQMMALLTTVPGTSVIIENIFENRFRVAEELKRMGARIKVEGRAAIIEGVESLQGTWVKATDLRAGAALVIAGLMAEGVTEIACAEYIYRGYYRMEEKLKVLGAQVWR